MENNSYLWAYTKETEKWFITDEFFTEEQWSEQRNNKFSKYKNTVHSFRIIKLKES